MPLYPKEKAFVLGSSPDNSSRWLPISDLATTALQQTTWFIDRVNGLATNSGLPGFPVDSVATIVSQWQGGVQGTRPRIGNVPLITITFLREAAVQPDVADPHSVLMDVDFSTNTTLLIVSAASAQTVAVSGTLASASAFAQTSAAGQISITDSSVADFHPYAMSSATVGGIFHDKTTGAIAWLYEPKSGANATGIVSKGKAPQTPGAITTPADAAITTGDLYEILTFPRIYFGAGSLMRQVPAGTAAGLFGGFAQIVYNRMWVTTAATGGFGDAWFPQTTADALTQAGPIIYLQECKFEPIYKVNQGIVQFVNCGFNDSSAVSASTGPGVVRILAGASYSGKQTFLGGRLTVDCDFLIDGAGSITCGPQSVVFVGTFSRWGTGRAFFNDGGYLHFQNVFLGSHVVYGTVGATNPVIGYSGDCTAHCDYAGAGTAVATFQFDSNVTNFQFPANGMGTSGFGFNSATGAFVGPTTNTWAHLDAALGAGTGFGNSAVDPISGCWMKAQ